MTRIQSVFAAALLTCLAGPLDADETARCGSKIIAVGMSQSDVLEHCGEPTARDVEQHAVHEGNRVVGTTPVERWTYSDYSATRVFVFDGDKLIRIE
jgi:hypothetical protein